jgi:hypothetical protein
LRNRINVLTIIDAFDLFLPFFLWLRDKRKCAEERKGRGQEQRGERFLGLKEGEEARYRGGREWATGMKACMMPPRPGRDL